MKKVVDVWCHRCRAEREVCESRGEIWEGINMGFKYVMGEPIEDEPNATDDMGDSCEDGVKEKVKKSEE